MSRKKSRQISLTAMQEPQAQQTQQVTQQVAEEHRVNSVEEKEEGNKSRQEDPMEQEEGKFFIGSITSSKLAFFEMADPERGTLFLGPHNSEIVGEPNNTTVGPPNEL